MPEKKDYFELMLRMIREISTETGQKLPQAFIQWFINLYFLKPNDIFISDGSGDGKIDAFFTTNNGEIITHHVINSKFTSSFGSLASPKFYEEISYFYNTFKNKSVRHEFLDKAVNPQLRNKYEILYRNFDNDKTKLFFLTNHKKNDKYYVQIKNLPIEVFHLDDLIQYIVDDIDGAMPKTPSLCLYGIRNVLPADKEDTTVSTSIIFARIIDFLNYMKDDPYDLLFARNVRIGISVSKSEVNKAIKETFINNPREFAYSNNGITILCDHHTYDPGEKELTIVNPRVVNGSQTLHTVYLVENPSPNARIMVRIIELPPISETDLPKKVLEKKKIITNIATRSNQQNPIKKWNLVSNDNFQMEIYRYFRKKGYYYERREGEWNQRSKELRSVNITKGPEIRKLAQLIASYYWDDEDLGPTNARKSVSSLFDERPYEKIQATPLELAYQIFLISRYYDESYKELSKEKKIINNYRGYINYVLFSVLIKALHSINKFKDKSLTLQLEHLKNPYSFKPKNIKKWKKLITEGTNFIHAAYKMELIKYKEKEGKDLSLNNFFNSSTSMGNIIKKNLPEDIVTAATSIIN